MSNETKDVSYLSDGQEMALALALLPIIPSILSIVGSSLIMRLVYKSGFKTPYRRIMFGMSFFDVVVTLTVSSWAFLVPAETSRRLWAVGNVTTCNAIAFFMTLGFSAFFYSGSLSLFYLLTVRFGKTDRYIQRYVEPWMHIVSIGWPLIGAIVPLALGMYGEVTMGTGCWIVDPEDCDPCYGPLTGWLTGGGPVLLVIAFLVVSNLTIYFHVRKTMLKARRGSMRSEQYSQRIQAVAVQAFLYVAAFLASYFWTLLSRAMESQGVDQTDEPRLFPLLVIQSILYPMLGFFNMFVFVRPRYLRVRASNFEQSRWFALKAVLIDDTETPQKPPRVAAEELEDTAQEFPSASYYFVQKFRSSLSRAFRGMGVNNTAREGSTDELTPGGVKAPGFGELPSSDTPNQAKGGAVIVEDNNLEMNTDSAADVEKATPQEDDFHDGDHVAVKSSE